MVAWFSGYNLAISLACAFGPMAGVYALVGRDSNAATALGGAGAGVLVWLAAWSATVLVDYALFANIEFIHARLDLSGGEYGPMFPFAFLWMCGMPAGLPAFGVIWLVGAVRRWRQDRMLVGAAGGTVLAGVGGLLATALTESYPLHELLVVGLGPFAAVAGSAGVICLGRKWAASMS
ncbi:hypothetical protein [Fimbriiglobus ruber]|uniref:hypothetical protein n=1 Tax=Fimbriiglobus ruber TaxID=1908690 RepID=UPI000B4AA9AA|nr:hypothetical protein [Fimbriiglobus ruber]